MKRAKIKHTFIFLICLGVASVLTSCFKEDPGALESGEKEFLTTGFNRLDIGNALVIDVYEGNEFRILATGDVRNLEDLKVYKNGSTLKVEFRHNRIRKHETYISIMMPELVGVDFSGASNAVVSGFGDVPHMDINISGASNTEINTQARSFNIDLSGASNLTLSGNNAHSYSIDLSGASNFNGYAIPADFVNVDASGASTAKVYVLEKLDITASGASSVFYKGDPSVNADLSGASTVQKD